MQPSGNDVLCLDLVMGGHDEMREHELLRRRWRIDTRYLHQLPLDPVWSEVAEKVELSPSRGFRAPIVRLTMVPCATPSIASCGSSTKLLRPSESQ
jgi:hypothetical protein